jgi:SnoaL-like domain
MSDQTSHSQSGGMEPGMSGVKGGAVAHLSPDAQESLSKWLAMVAEKDFRDLPSIVAVDAVFRSPVGLKPYPGRDLVCLMLRTAAGIFEDFEYHRTFVNDENAALEFSAHIGDVQLKAVHIIRFNAAGKIADIEKLVRPVEAARALGNAMGAKIGPQIKAMRADTSTS